MTNNMPAPCEPCKDTCGAGAAACGTNCTCGPNCACGDGNTGNKPCCQGGKK